MHESETGGEMTKLCPDCKKNLAAVNYGGITLDTCGMCGGIWFDQGEMGRALKLGPGAMEHIEADVKPELKAVPESLSGRSCPDCLEPLAKYHYSYNSPVELDACIVCGGFWVEDGELNNIQQWTVQGQSRLKATEADHAEMAAYLAKAEIDHERFMQRAATVRDFLTAIDLRPGQMFRFSRR